MIDIDYFTDYCISDGSTTIRSEKLASAWSALTDRLELRRSITTVKKRGHGVTSQLYIEVRAFRRKGLKMNEHDLIVITGAGGFIAGNLVSISRRRVC